MPKTDLDKTITDIKNRFKNEKSLVVRMINIGRENPLTALIVYNNLLTDKNVIDRDILNVLMHYIYEDLSQKDDVNEYLVRTYISLGNTYSECDFEKIIEAIKRGKTIICTENSIGYIIADTTGGNYRIISEPENETSIKDSKEGFVENLEMNLSMIRRIIKDESFSSDILTVGERTQTNIALVYLKDISDDNLIVQIKEKLSSINADKASSAGFIEQYIEHDSYCIFPQYLSTQRVDRIVSAILEGKVAIVIEGTPSVLVAPSTFYDFFQSADDYYERTVIASFIRILRILAVIVVTTMPAIYLTLLKYNTELIPIKFINPIIQSRTGIALTPFLEILSMEILIEFLREGGLRLPSKIAQTLSVVGGIIIGDTAIQSKIVSPSTLLIVGATVVASFLIPNYDMSLSIRFIRFPMLILANVLGILGIGIGWFYILIILFSMENYGVEYLKFNKNDMKDIFIRAPIWKMNKRPEIINNKDKIRQTDFRKKWSENSNNDE